MLVCVDTTIVASWRMIVISDVMKAQEAIIYKEKLGRLHLFLGRIVRQQESITTFH